MTDERDESRISRSELEICTNQGTLEAVIMPTICVCKDSVLVLQASVTPDRRVVDGREGTSKRPGCWKPR